MHAERTSAVQRSRNRFPGPSRWAKDRLELLAASCRLDGVGQLDVARYVVAVPLAVLFLWGTAFNLWVCSGALFPGRKRPSIGPGPGLFGAVAMLVMPVEGLWRYAWIPLIVDPGTVIIPWGIISSIKQEHPFRAAMCVARFQSVNDAGRRLDLSLYRNGEGILKCKVTSPPRHASPPPLVQSSMLIRWSWNGDRLDLSVGGQAVIYRVALDRTGSPSRTMQWSSDSGPSDLDRIDLELVSGSLWA